MPARFKTRLFNALVACLAAAGLFTGCQLAPFSPQQPPHIIFVSNRDGHLDLYRMNIESQRVDRLGSDGTTKTRPAWSPVRRQLAYLASRPAGGLGLYRSEPPAWQPVLLSDSLPVRPSPVGWSPDGNWIAFTAGQIPDSEVYVADAAGTKRINLSNHPAGDVFAGWAPDSRRLLFVSERMGRLLVFMVAVDGGEPVQLTDSASDSGEPAWSPDGRWLVFSARQDEAIEIFRMDTSSGDVVQLTVASDYSGYSRWSPDANQIAFLTNRDGNAEIYVMRPDGSQLTNLTQTPAASEATLGDFSFSPDGRQILFHSQHTGNSELFLLDLDDQTVTNLTRNPAIDLMPVWVD